MTSMQQCPGCGVWCWYGIEHRCAPVVTTTATALMDGGHSQSCAVIQSESTRPCDCAEGEALRQATSRPRRPGIWQTSFDMGWAAHEAFVASTPRDEDKGCIDRTCGCAHIETRVPFNADDAARLYLCDDCPDHEGCVNGIPCEVVKRVQA